MKNINISFLLCFSIFALRATTHHEYNDAIEALRQSGRVLPSIADATPEKIFQVIEEIVSDVKKGVPTGVNFYVDNGRNGELQDIVVAAVYDERFSELQRFSDAARKLNHDVFLFKIDHMRKDFDARIAKKRAQLNRTILYSSIVGIVLLSAVGLYFYGKDEKQTNIE